MYWETKIVFFNRVNGKCQIKGGIEMDRKIFVDWHPYNHPTLGEVEIGGWPRTKTSPPEGELIQIECETWKD